MPGTNTSSTEIISGEAQSVSVSADTLTVDLVDGRTIAVPLAWYPRLLNATRKERHAWRLTGRGEGIRWPDIEEDISVAGLLAGRPSFEKRESFEKWLTSRKKRRRRSNVSRRRRAFTLVELLVVIAIISVLAALLMPALRSAIKASRSVACMNNEKQMGLLLDTYGDEYNGYYPKINPSHYWKVANGDAVNANDWPEVLGGLYLEYATSYNAWGAGRYGLFSCPSAQERWRNKGSLVFEGATFGHDYGINRNLIPSWSGVSSWEPFPIQKTSLNRTVIAVADSYNNSQILTPTSSSFFPDGEPKYGVQPRHSGRANFLFTDSHVESSAEYSLPTGIGNFPWKDE